MRASVLVLSLVKRFLMHPNEFGSLLSLAMVKKGRMKEWGDSSYHEQHELKSKIEIIDLNSSTQVL